MSLVHDALRQSTTTAGGNPPPVAAASWPQHLAGYRRPAAWLAAGMLIAAPVAWLLARPQPGQPAAPASVVTVMPTAAVMPTPAATVPVALPQEQQPAVPAAEPAPAQTIASAVVPAPAPAPEATPAPARIPAPVATPAPAVSAIADNTPAPASAPTPSQIQLSVHRLGNTGNKAVADDGRNAVAVRMAMSTLNAAVARHDTTATTQAIAQLQTLLPAQSLTLLRARAWAAHGSGDYVDAERLYRTILNRVPDDEHAGINLALLDARRGDMDDARARLTQMAARNSRSPQIAQALAELDAARQ
ncbi:tetratricopeptide repeat protein [Stenotrophomonas sp. NLF4-10]|uniref:tetratricopeptide repeat protein n=1 Tax=Stenotrophomonas sp. NLF4-10 TaxID=2918754 RepID=UPI001EFA7FED|nr:tetratricopeptide repeat protein [Stenotrophomonas sp. NLF4-10]MCG8277702.1 tetratricopeptide repeat protein [Stenotrophomonas sp. NLF4-10]